jgi:anti-anti-sigma regulatory factor
MVAPRVRAPPAATLTAVPPTEMNPMSTTALFGQPTTLPQTAVAWAPPRLDVHHLPELDAWIGSRTAESFGERILDCSAVEFVDQATVEAILTARHDPRCRLRIARPSTAMRITFELLGHPIDREAVAA